MRISVSRFQAWLLARGVDHSKWIRKTTKDLHQEFVAGESNFEVKLPKLEQFDEIESELKGIDKGPSLIRKVQLVSVRIPHAHMKGFVLVEHQQRFFDNVTGDLVASKSRGNQFLSEKMKPGELPVDAAIRGIQEELAQNEVEVEDLNHHLVTKDNKHGAYQGLVTRYQIHLVEAKLAGITSLEAITIRESKQLETEFRWVKEEDRLI